MSTILRSKITNCSRKRKLKSNKPLSPVNSSKKLTSIERIANKIEESKINSSFLNSELEYYSKSNANKNHDQNTNANNHKDSKSTDKMIFKHKINDLNIGKSRQISSLLDNAKYKKDENSAKDKNRYRNNIITKSHREFSIMGKYKNIHKLDIIGEPIIGSTNRLKAIK